MDIIYQDKEHFCPLFYVKLVSYPFPLFRLQPKMPLPQDANSGKLVTTQASGLGKPAAALSSQTTAQSASPTILDISSVQPNVSKK